MLFCVRGNTPVLYKTFLGWVVRLILLDQWAGHPPGSLRARPIGGGGLVLELLELGFVGRRSVSACVSKGPQGQRNVFKITRVEDSNFL